MLRNRYEKFERNKKKNKPNDKTKQSKNERHRHETEMSGKYVIVSISRAIKCTAERVVNIEMIVEMLIITLESLVVWNQMCIK